MKKNRADSEPDSAQKVYRLAMVWAFCAKKVNENPAFPTDAQRLPRDAAFSIQDLALNLRENYLDINFRTKTVHKVMYLRGFIAPYQSINPVFCKHVEEFFDGVIPAKETEL